MDIKRRLAELADAWSKGGSFKHDIPKLVQDVLAEIERLEVWQSRASKFDVFYAAAITGLTANQGSLIWTESDLALLDAAATAIAKIASNR